MKSNIFYNFNNILSYNAMFNFIIGERGVGKTFGAKKFCINRFLKNGEQFIYLRRYKTELKESAGDTNKFFPLDLLNLFPDKKFSIKGEKIMCDKQVMGYVLALSTANILKSTSFDKVKYIIFDEYIIDKGCYRYLTNEVEQFLDFVETIARLRDVKVFFLGNAISSTNPYFTYFNLTLPYNSDVKRFKDGLILVNYIKNEVYRKVKHDSNFGKIIEGTQYSKYAIDNEFLRDSKSFIKHKSKNAKHFFILKYKQINYGIWNDYNEGVLYISYDYDPNCPVIFTVDTDDHNEQTKLLKLNSSIFFKAVINHFREGCLCFENQQIKNNIMNLMSRHLTY